MTFDIVKIPLYMKFAAQFVRARFTDHDFKWMDPDQFRQYLSNHGITFKRTGMSAHERGYFIDTLKSTGVSTYSAAASEASAFTNFIEANNLVNDFEQYAKYMAEFKNY